MAFEAPLSYRYSSGPNPAPANAGTPRSRAGGNLAPEQAEIGPSPKSGARVSSRYLTAAAPGEIDTFVHDKHYCVLSTDPRSLLRRWSERTAQNPLPRPRLRSFARTMAHGSAGRDFPSRLRWCWPPE